MRGLKGAALVAVTILVAFFGFIAWWNYQIRTTPVTITYEVPIFDGSVDVIVWTPSGSVGPSEFSDNVTLVDGFNNGEICPCGNYVTVTDNAASASFTLDTDVRVLSNPSDWAYQALQSDGSIHSESHWLTVTPEEDFVVLHARINAQSAPESIIWDNASTLPDLIAGATSDSTALVAYHVISEPFEGRVTYTTPEQSFEAREMYETSPWIDFWVSHPGPNTRPFDTQQTEHLASTTFELQGSIRGAMVAQIIWKGNGGLPPEYRVVNCTSTCHIEWGIETPEPWVMFLSDTTVLDSRPSIDVQSYEIDTTLP